MTAQLMLKSFRSFTMMVVGVKVAVILSVFPITADARSMYNIVDREYVTAPNAPSSQPQAEMDQKSKGCVSCHTGTDSKTMHVNPGVKLGCTDCHGGDPSVSVSAGAEKGEQAYIDTQELAHVLPSVPDRWPTSRNPERTYSLLNKESPEFIRFINPSDYRIVDEACGACHQDTIEASKRSLHATGAMLWGGASYNNGILPFKNYVLGESYDRDGEPVKLLGPAIEDQYKQLAKDKGVVEALLPLPAWETVKPGDIFRTFERGGRNILNLFPETGIPNSLGLIQRLEEPGRPDYKASNRGPGTGNRIAVPVINITKTRLNDPITW